MPVHIEYVIPLPFCSETEFKRGLEFTEKRQRELLKTSANGESVTLVECSELNNGEVPEPIQQHGRIAERAHYTRNRPVTFTWNKIYLGSRFPSWIVMLLGNNPSYLTIDEKYYSAYPYTLCVYESPLFAKQLHFTIESLHVKDDNGSRDDVFSDMTPAERGMIKKQVVDISKTFDSSATGGTFVGDPTTHKCSATGRGPLAPGRWWEKWSRDTHGPIMTVYKRAVIECDIVFGDTIASMVHESTIRDLAVQSFRNMFTWMELWH